MKPALSPREGVEARLKRVLAEPVAGAAVRVGLGPGALTLLGLALAVGSGALIALGWLVAGGALLLLGSGIDAVDGIVARSTGRATKGGAVLDSVADRAGEGAVFSGIAWYGLHLEPVSVLTPMLAIGAMVASLLVSYVRARAEAVEVECRVGLFTRPERVLLLGAGLLARHPDVALAVVATGAALTALHRLVHVMRRADRDGSGVR